MPPNT